MAKRGRYIVFIVTIITVASCLVQTIARAADATWMNATDIKTRVRTSNSIHDDCLSQRIEVIVANGSVSQYSACVTPGITMTTARYIDENNRGHVTVKIGNDTRYRIISNFEYYSLNRHVKGTDRIVYLQQISTISSTMSTVENAVSELTPESYASDGQIISYKINFEHAKRWLSYTSDGQTKDMAVHSWTVSDNGRYMLLWVEYKTYIVIDFDTSTMTAIGIFNGSWYGGASANPYAGAITNDGRYAFIYGGPSVVDTEGCGYAVTQDILASGKLFDVTMPHCPVKSYRADVVTAVGYQGYDESYKLSDNEKSLEFFYQTYPVSSITGEPQVVTIHIGDQRRLDYLALGDSFSSGEGDTEKRTGSDEKYYRYLTDNNEDARHGLPKEKCHVSERSYPYQLAHGMGLGDPSTDPYRMQWQSIACSGATAWDVKEQGSDGYLGQGDRLKNYDYATLKTTALNEMIPGRQKQIEFVKKYQPKVITLTVGGNDVGFGDKIFNCVMSPGECDFALPSWRNKLKDEIKNQFDNLSNLYQELVDATNGNTKIYVLGYPQFINGDPGAQCENIGMLDANEREMIVNSIIYLNNVIEQAAKHAGVKYIDIENALGGHRLCDKDTKYVTAITNVFGINGNERQESFHPNDLGQSNIASSVWDQLNNQSLIDYDICSGQSTKVCPNNDNTEQSASVPPYFGDANIQSETKFIYYTLTNGTLVKSIQSYSVWTGKYIYQPGTKVDITLYSNPTFLGQFSTSTTGSIDGKITIPSSVPAGYHTLVIKGKSYSGEPLELYQVVEVRGSDSHDIDEDGIDDSIDKCAYIIPSNTDIDKDGIDDACDPFINDRVIHADESKNSIEVLNEKSNTTKGFNVDNNIARGDNIGIDNDTKLNQYSTVYKVNNDQQDSSNNREEKTTDYRYAIMFLSIIIALMIVIFRYRLVNKRYRRRINK